MWSCSTPAVLTTGRLVLGGVELVDGFDAAVVGVKALELFDPAQPGHAARRGVWRVAPLESIDAELPAGTARGRERWGGAAPACSAWPGRVFWSV